MFSTSKYTKFLFLTGIIFFLPIFVNAQTSAPSNQQPSSHNNNASCTVCGSTPQQIEDFISMTTSILDILWTRYSTGILAGEYKVFGPWQAWLYGQALAWDIWSVYKSLVAGTIRNLDQKQSYIRTTSELLGIYTKDIIEDGVIWFAVVAQPWPMVRDYQRLQDVDTILADKISEMWAAGWFSKTLDEATISSIRDVMKAQEGSGKLFTTITIENNVKPSYILRILMSINKKHKNLIVLSKKTSSDSEIDLSKWNEKITIDFNDNYRSNLKETYACARLWSKNKMACSAQFSDFTKRIKNISENFVKNWPKQSREKIETSAKRLKIALQKTTGKTDNDFYKKNKDDYETREAELLSSQWFKKREPWLTGLFSSNIPRSIEKSIKDGSLKAKDISERFKQLWNNIKWLLDTIAVNKRIKGEEKEKKSITDDINIVQPSIAQESKNLYIIANLTTIEEDHAKRLQEQSKASTDDSIDKLADMLSRIRLLNSIIYNPNKKDTIYENIARACELQCTNLWGTCRL